FMRLTSLFTASAILASAVAINAAQAPTPAAPQAPAAPAAGGPPQQPPQPVPPSDLPRPATTDPRANLKPGGPGQKAAEAAWNMELMSNLPKPEGFYDKDLPLGVRAPQPAPGAPRTPPNPNALSYTNSDLAFKDNMMIVGNYHGFNTYNIERANRPQLIASVVCPGGQGDVSIFGNLLFMSVEQTRGRLDCGRQGVVPPVSNERFRGVRIFDITDMKAPKQVAAVQTCRGSHTHTLVPDVKDKSHIYLYASGTGQVRSGEELVGCSGKAPNEDPNSSLFSIDVIEVPLAEPSKARIVNQPRLFASAEGNIAGLWAGGDHGPNTQRTSVTNQCHDITVYAEIGLAAGACAGNGILLDIRDPRNPKRLDFVFDKGFAYWHSATFNNDGTKVLFTDEWGGGGQPRCRAVDPLTWGADAIYDIVDGKMIHKGYFKMPSAQTDQENCVAHNGSLIPVPGRDIMVQAWYQGGLSVFDFTDSANAKEIAYFDRGPINGEAMLSGGYWSTYWYNGNLYGAEMARGIDVFRLKPSEFLTQNEIDAAVQFRLNEFNSQNQPKVVWEPTAAVARAYMDQLQRSKLVNAARYKSVSDAMGKTGGQAAIAELEKLAGEFDSDAAKATGQDQKRMKALAETLRGRAARLK
ncbi:MAG: LVIVD repeat-containing protein, partial [Acidimicrobiia bacterium]